MKLHLPALAPIAALSMLFCSSGAISSDLDSTLLMLDNGLHVVICRRPHLPLVAIDFWVRAGSADEAPNQNGCAHFLEHTLFKGTASRSSGAADFEIESLGGVLNAATGQDYAHYYTEVPTASADQAAGIIADIVRHATFPDVQVERERAVILDELAKHDADQMARLHDSLYMYGSPTARYKSSPGGRPDAIRTRARDSLAAFFQIFYIPSRCTLALAGDITPAQAKKIAQDKFGDWLDSQSAAPSAATATPPRPDLHGDHDAVGMAYPAPSAHDEQLACVAQVCAALLGGPSEGGRLSSPAWDGTEALAAYTPHREASLLTIVARMPDPIPPRPFEAAPTPAFASAVALEAALRSAVESLAARPPSVSELANAVGRLQGRIEYDTETDSGLAHAAGLADLIGADPPAQALTRLAHITPTDVKQYASAWLNARHAVIVRSGPWRDAGRPQ